MLWSFFVVMSLMAIGFGIWPLLKDLPRQTLLVGISIVLITGTAAGLYNELGSPDVASGASQSPDVSRMVTSLAERLQRQPDDIDGWVMLGRSYVTLGNYPEAVRAYERAVELESAQNAQTLVALGVALVEGNERQISPRAVSVFENALALEPNNAEALFWGGISAFNSGNSSLAADRWELLLGTNPPEQIRGVLQVRIAEWRGEPPPVATAAAAPVAVVLADVRLSADARAALPMEATIFIIARDPAQPSPPIAVTRRLLSELPFAVELGDQESMIPGRNLSGFTEFEMIARASVSGNPTAQTGDWFGSIIVRPAEGKQVALSISEQIR